jgi:hypothetical protein
MCNSLIGLNVLNILWFDSSCVCCSIEDVGIVYMLCVD